VHLAVLMVEWGSLVVVSDKEWLPSVGWDIHCCQLLPFVGWDIRKTFVELGKGLVSVVLYREEVQQYRLH